MTLANNNNNDDNHDNDDNTGLGSVARQPTRMVSHFAAWSMSKQTGAEQSLREEEMGQRRL